MAADAVIHTHCLALLPPLFDFGPLPSCPHGSLSLSPSPLNHFSLCRISRFDDPKDRLFHVHLISLFSHFSMFFFTHIPLIVVAEHHAQELDTSSLLTGLDQPNASDQRHTWSLQPCRSRMSQFTTPPPKPTPCTSHPAHLDLSTGYHGSRQPIFHTPSFKL